MRVSKFSVLTKRKFSTGKNILRLSLYLVLFFLNWKNASSQSAYRVTYRQSWGSGYQMKNILVFNDSLCLSFFVNENNPDPFAKNGIYGNKVIHHSVLLDNISKTIYDGVNYNVVEPFLIKDTLRWLNWTFPDKKEEKIMGYICKAAEYKDDKSEVTAWYTTEIPYKYGPAYCFGLPGLVLKMSYKTPGTKTIATKIEKGDFKIVMPENVKIVDIETYLKSKKLQK